MKDILTATDIQRTQSRVHGIAGQAHWTASVDGQPGQRKQALSFISLQQSASSRTAGKDKETHDIIIVYCL